MHVALCLGCNQIGGTERQVSLLAKGLLRVGVPVTVFFMARPITFKRRAKLDFGHVRCIHVWNTRFLRRLSIKYFARCLRKTEISIAHMFDLSAMEQGLAAAKLAGITNTVGGVRGLRFSEDPTIRNRLATASQRIKGLTCNCNAIKDLLVTLNICSPEKIKVIANGVVTDSSARRKTYRRRRNYFNVMFVGTLKEVKDPLTFIRGAELALSTAPKCRFTIAGDGPLRSTVERMIESGKLARHFALLGTVPPQHIPYQTADLLVSTSIREGSSNAILEALAQGVPVIGTAVGGTKELLQNHSFGRLVEPRDVEGIALAIKYFYDRDDGDMEVISNEAIAFVRKGYSVKRMVEEHLAFYKGISQR